MTDEEIKARNRPMANDEIDFWLTTAEALNDYGDEEMKFFRNSGAEAKRDAMIIAGVMQGISKALNKAISQAVERRKAASK